MKERQRQGSNLTSRVCPKCGLSVSTSVTRCPNDGTLLLNKSEIGKELAEQYEFLSIIASGGMGVIYEARNLVLNQKVAIKMMKTDKLDEKHIKRFRKEAEALAALDHPNIIHVRTYGLTENGEPYMVLDFIEGMSMSQLIQSRGPIPIAFATEFFVQVADALAHAHERGVWHQDLKPNNIMICESGQHVPYVKLIDFGIAKIINGEATPAGLTDTGDVLGSPAYMSPEQASGGKVNFRTDIYSLGCVMFEALTGTQPFSGTTALEVISHQINTKPPALSERSITDFPPRLEAIVARALEKNPANRYQSMGELRDALLEFVQESRAEPGKTKPLTAAQKFNNSMRSPRAMVIGGIILSIAVLATNIGIYISKSAHEDELAHQRLINQQQKEQEEQRRKDAEAPYLDRNAVARQMIREEMQKWHTGGEFHLRVENDDSVLDEFGKLPPLPTFMDMENSSVKGPGLAYLIRYPLDHLSLNESSMTDRAFLEIKHMKRLKQLQFDNTSITGKNFDALQNLPQLTRISARLDHLDDDSMKSISKLKHLIHLQCGRNDKITSVGYDYLGSAPELMNLDAMENPIDTKAAKSIGALKKIKYLSLERTNITDEGLKEISSNNNLRELYLQYCQHLTGEGLKHLANLRGLGCLTLEGNKQLGDAELAALKNYPSLRRLDLRNTSVGDKTMNLIRDSSIKTLYIQGTKVTESGLLTLADNKRMEMVEVAPDQFSKATVEKFEQKRPGLLHFFGDHESRSPFRL